MDRFACSAAVTPVPGRPKDMNIVVQVSRCSMHHDRSPSNSSYLTNFGCFWIGKLDNSARRIPLFPLQHTSSSGGGQDWEKHQNEKEEIVLASS
jgi:hypothetical protein